MDNLDDIVIDVARVFKQHNFPLNSEKECQRMMGDVFKDYGFDFEREYRLDKGNILDFYFFAGIAIEVKLRGGAAQILKQCERYCEFDEVKALILVTNRAMGFPDQINGKPCYYISLGKAWL